MSTPKLANRALRLYNGLKEGSTVFATFLVLKGGRTAQVIANTGLDVSPLNPSAFYPTHVNIQAVIVDCEHGQTFFATPDNARIDCGH